MCLNSEVYIGCLLLITHQTSNKWVFTHLYSIHLTVSWTILFPSIKLLQKKI